MNNFCKTTISILKKCPCGSVIKYSPQGSSCFYVGFFCDDYFSVFSDLESNVDENDYFIKNIIFSSFKKHSIGKSFILYWPDIVWDNDHEREEL